WPGNVRELQNVIERAILLSNNQTIGSNELGLPTMAETGQSVKAPALSLDDYLVDFVTKHQHHMSETQMAEHLGISRKSLWEKRQRLDIPRTPRK
ncbi:MAG TPA: response regulator, partial [Gammaproteobacteria bacterium]|nr:response regulator [Gammaproteobacteria bacterium]